MENIDYTWMVSIGGVQCWDVYEYLFNMTKLNLDYIKYEEWHQSGVLCTLSLANGRQLSNYWEETSLYSSFSELFAVLNV